MSSKIAADFDLVSTVHISHYSFVVSRVVLHSSAQIVLTLFSDEDYSFSKSIVLNIEGEEYQKWGSDDSYISELVAAKVASLKPLEPLPEPKEEELSAEEPKAEEDKAKEELKEYISELVSAKVAELLPPPELKAEELKAEELKE